MADVTVKMNSVQFQCIVGAMMDRKKNAVPPLNRFGMKLHDDLLQAMVREDTEVDLR